MLLSLQFRPLLCLGQSCSKFRDCICFTGTSVSVHYLHCPVNRNKYSGWTPEHVVLGDINISLTLDGLLADPSSSSIRTINLQDTDLTQILREISTFTSQLETLKLNRNRISRIYHGAFHCSPALRSLNLSSNELMSINPGAFEGILEIKLINISIVNLHIGLHCLITGYCSSARIDLSLNRLTRLESVVFQPLLEQMYLRSHRIGVGSTFQEVAY